MQDEQTKLLKQILEVCTEHFAFVQEQQRKTDALNEKTLAENKVIQEFNMEEIARVKKSRSWGGLSKPVVIMSAIIIAVVVIVAIFSELFKRPQNQPNRGAAPNVWKQAN